MRSLLQAWGRAAGAGAARGAARREPGATRALGSAQSRPLEGAGPRPPVPDAALTSAMSVPAPEAVRRKGRTGAEP